MEKNPNPFVCRCIPLIGVAARHESPNVRAKVPFVDKHPHSGFTLIELLAALVVLGILTAIGAPAFRSVMLDGRIKAQTEDLATALNVARSEATKVGATTSLCISNDRATCTGIDWKNGWIVWVNNDEDTTVDAGERVIRVAAGAQSSVTVGASPAHTSISFKSDGTTNKDDLFAFAVCDDARTGETGRQIKIEITGKIAVSQKTDCG
jgi:type IV fimbrial biogenesis protein FimT